MYIWVAAKNPLEDNSVPGWMPNYGIICHSKYANIIHEIPYANLQNMVMRNYILHYLELLIEDIEDKGLVVPFTAEELMWAITEGEEAINALPQIHAGAVCCYEVDSVEEWVELYLVDLERIGYFEDGELSEGMRIWQVWGKIKDIDDMEGVYIIPTDAKDITEEAMQIIYKYLED